MTRVPLVASQPSLPLGRCLPGAMIMKSANDVLIRTGRIKLPDGTMFWHEAGQGDTIVFLHGSWHHSSQWLPVIHHLAPSYHCLAPDLLGFGESSRRQPLSITLEVHALHDWLAALRVHNCVLAAHSLGAWVAMQYALHYPQQVRGLALIHPEGLATQNAESRWRLDRWLTRPLSPLPWLLLASAPLLARLGFKAQANVWQRYQLLRRSPAACQLLFRRRAAAIAAELVSPQQLALEQPTLLLEPSALGIRPQPWAYASPAGALAGQYWPVPAASTELGVEAKATATALQNLMTLSSEVLVQ